VKESQRLVAEYEKLFDGSAWIDVNIVDTLKPLSAAQASSKPFRNANSIWQIVNHLVSWREAILKRLKDETVTAPANNFFEPVKDISETAWRKTMDRLEQSQVAWVEAIKASDDAWLEKIWKPGMQSRYELVQGILQHDCYHLGQIVLLKKFV